MLHSQDHATGIARPSEYRPRLGITRSSEYRAREAGLIPPPLRLGPRAVGLPRHEVDIMIAARVAGKSDDEVREIVARLVAARQIDIDAMLEGAGA